MSLLQNRAFGTFTQDASGSPASTCGSRTPVNATSVRGRLSFGTMRGGRASSFSTRTRNDRSLSPGARNSSGSTGQLADSDRRLEDDRTQLDDMGDPRTSRPLSSIEHEVFEEAVTNAGLDAKHREYALVQAEIQGPFRHLALSVGQAKVLFDMSSISDKIINVSNQVGSVLDLVEAALVRIERLSVKIEGIADKVEGFTDQVDTLTELIQSNPNVPSLANGPGSVGANQQAPSGEAWTCAPELRAAIVSAAHRFIILPTLESYTALENPDREWLAHSLFNCIKTAVRQHAPLAHFLPPQVNGVSDVQSTRAYHTEIKNVSKHVRERLHLLLLTGVYDSKHAVAHGAVPNLKSLVHRIVIKLGQTGDHADIESVWADTTELARCRIAYLRREALRIFQKGRGSSSIWAAVDTQLDDLRHRGNDYTASFYNLIYEDDRSTFDGQARYEDISEVAEFRLPFEEEVNAAIIGQANNLE